MPAYYETENYAFNFHRVGASITRKRDNTSVYFQPGDATEDASTAIGHCLTHKNAAQQFDAWCSDFSELFGSHAARKALCAL